MSHMRKPAHLYHPIVLYKCKIMSFWIGLNQINGGVMTSYRFSRWRPCRRKSTRGFEFSVATPLTMSKSIFRPNFNEIYQYLAEILPLPFSENKHAPYCNSTSGFDFDQFIVIIVLFCISLPNFIQIESNPAEL